MVLLSPGGIFLNRRIWAISSSAAAAIAADIKLVQVRDIATKALEQWQLLGGVVQTYGKWLDSTADGFADGVKMVTQVLLVPGGFEIHFYKEGVHIAGKLVDSLGKEIKELGGAVVDAIKNLLGGGILW
jgi:hypothetical protein